MPAYYKNRERIGAITVHAILAIMLSTFLFASMSSNSVSQSQTLEQPGAIIEWSRTYGGPEDDLAYSMIEASDGIYVLAGYTTSYGAGGCDFWLVQTNSTGDIVWNKTYGGADWDIARSLISTSDGGYASAGYTYSYGVGEYDFWLIKTNSSGSLQWSNTYGTRDNDYANSVVQTIDGGYAMAGYTNSSTTQLADFLLVKTDPNGIEQWSQTYGERYNDIAYSVVQTYDGGFALAGYTRASGNGNLLLVKTDLFGNLQWSKTYGGADYDTGYSVTQISDGGFTLAGCTRSQGSGGYDFWLIKTDSDGDINWTKTYGGTTWDVAYSSIQTSDTAYALAGYTASYGAGSQDFWLVKTGVNGNSQWNVTIGGSMSDIARCLIQTSDTGYALAGYTNSYGAGANDFYLVKIAPTKHDVAVLNIAPFKTAVGQGFSASFNVTIQNQGSFVDTISLTLYADQNITAVGDEVVVASESLTLSSGLPITVTISWDTATGAKGKYTITASAGLDPPELDEDPNDNSITHGNVVVTTPGNINGDEKIDVHDLFELGQAFMSSPAAPNWNSNADINNSEAIDDIDLLILAPNYSRSDI